MYSKSLKSIIHQITFDRDNRDKIFLELAEAEKSYVLTQLPKHTQYELMILLADSDITNTIEKLDPDEATDIIQLLPKLRQQKILDTLNKNLRDNIELLNKFDPETAAGIMNLDYIQVDTNDKIADIAKRFKVHEKRTGRLPAIIVSLNGKVKGYLPGHTLGFAKPADLAKKYIRRIYTINHHASHDQVVELFHQHPHNKIAVTGKRGNVLGIIYSDDILRILKEQESASLYEFAGVHEEESVADGALKKIKFRYQWLVINMATAFLASFIVSLFDKTISQYVLLAVYMPIVAGMGGNAGTQTLAVLVRGITLKQIELKTAWPTLKREMLAGLGNGLINGLVVASVVLIVNHDLKIALILGIAMIANLLVAAFFGTLVPLIMRRLGKDPATSATIFITTATDVLGFLAFLGLATLILL